MKFKLVLLLILLLLLTACMSKYYNRYGGYPMNSETLTVIQDNMEVKLMVTYRQIYPEQFDDGKTINVSIRTIVAANDLTKLNVDRIAVAAKDSSYFYSFANPLIYDRFGKHPISLMKSDLTNQNKINSSDQPCVFTVNRFTTDYQIILSFKVLNKDGVWEEKQQVIPLLLPQI